MKRGRDASSQDQVVIEIVHVRRCQFCVGAFVSSGCLNLQIQLPTSRCENSELSCYGGGLKLCRDLVFQARCYTGSICCQIWWWKLGGM